MLSQITIKNFGLIDELSIEFQSGFNILTGETGAGKSIIIDALRYALGNRLLTSQIRKKELPCIVEAVFDLSKEELAKLPVFSEYLSEDESILIINRTYTPDGRNKNKINGLTVTTTQLKEIGNHLVDFHGPHDHQMLLFQNTHLGILDRLCGIDELKETYTKKFREYNELQKKIEEIKAMTQFRERELDLLSYQIKELEQVPLDSEQYEEFLQKQAMINNVEELCTSTTNLIQLLEDENTGIVEMISQASTIMKRLNEVDNSTAPLAEYLIQAQENVEHLLYELKDYFDRLSFDPEEAQQINTICNIYEEILHKYGPTLENAKKFYEEIKKKYEFLLDIEHNDSELHSRLEKIHKELQKLAGQITAKRKETAKKLQQTIEKELSELGMSQVKFECRIEKTELNPYGHDEVIFFISPNPGEALKPLAEIVSSGEAARVMLALKRALTEVDPIPVLIFDEIDAQIGGRLGTIIGRKLKELAKNRQVILVTHLPQIASFGNAHYKILKKIDNNKTTITVELLDHDGRIKELAQMMSGKKHTKISLVHAHEMLAKAK